MFTSYKKLVPAMRSFRSTVSISINILPVMHSFNANVHFSDDKGMLRQIFVIDVNAHSKIY